MLTVMVHFSLKQLISSEVNEIHTKSYSNPRLYLQVPRKMRKLKAALNVHDGESSKKIPQALCM